MLVICYENSLNDMRDKQRMSYDISTFQPKMKSKQTLDFDPNILKQQIKIIFLVFGQTFLVLNCIEVIFIKQDMKKLL